MRGDRGEWDSPTDHLMEEERGWTAHVLTSCFQGLRGGRRGRAGEAGVVEAETDREEGRGER